MSRQYLHFRSVVHVHSYGPSRQSTLPPIPNNIGPDKTDLFCRGWKQSNTAVSIVNIPKPRRSCSWTYKINREAESRIRHESTPNAKRRSNTTKKHTRTRGKRENWTPARNNAHDNLVPEAEKREPGNDVEHMVDKKLRHLPWIISPLNNLSGMPNRCRWMVENSRIRPDYEGVRSRTKIVTSCLGIARSCYVTTVGVNSKPVQNTQWYR